MSASGAPATSVAALQDVDLRKVVQEKILYEMIKHVTQLTRGWVILIVDDEATRILTQVARMSDLTDSGVSLLERLELERQPFPEMNAVYFIAPTAANLRRLTRDFEDAEKPQYNDVYLYFLYHATDDAFTELKHAPRALVQRLKVLQEVNVDFLAREKCAFTLGMPEAFHTLYSPRVKTSEKAAMVQCICHKLVSVCATLEEYPYVRYQAGHVGMETMARMFQHKMNDYVAQNSKFSYALKRGTLLFIDRGQDMVTPLMHESTFQAMTYDLLEVTDDQVSYEAETPAGTARKTAFLNENDKQWVKFRHTHIAKVSTEIGKSMTALSTSSAGTSLGRGSSTDLHDMAAALRELPEYREMLGKLSQHLSLARKAMDIFTSTALLEASNIEQTLATGVKPSGKKLKHSKIVKQLKRLFKDPRLTEKDRFRVAAIFLLTQDTMKEGKRNKVIQSALLSKKHGDILDNMQLVAGPTLYKQNGISLLLRDEVKMAAKKAKAVEYSNARYDPKLKAIVTKALKRTLSETEYPYIITPPPLSSSADSSNKPRPVSLKKKTRGKRKPQEAAQESKAFSGEKMIVFVSGGATYSELRSIYEVRIEEKRDVLLGSTALLAPPTFITSLETLKEAHSVNRSALTASVYAKDTVSSVKDTQCIDRSTVAALETKLDDLQQSNDALQLQLDSQSAEKAQWQTKVNNEHTSIVQKLENEVAARTKDVEKLEEDVLKQKKTGKKVETELTTAVSKLHEKMERVSSCGRDMKTMEATLAKEQGTLASTEAELKAALAKLSEETTRTMKLEKNLQALKKKNQALTKELAKVQSEELTMATVLSSFYDSALELVEQSVDFAREKMHEQSETLEQVQSKIEGAKKTAYDTTSKFYQENLATTLDPILVDVRKTADPILADVHKAVNPHVEQYLPLVQHAAAKLKEQAVLYSREALRRAKLARIEAITLLERNKHVAPYAQKVVDGVLVMLALPLVLFQIRLALHLFWWLFTTAVCVLTCGLCCGTRKRSLKSKRKVVKKTASVSASLSAPVNGPTKKTTTSKAASTVQNRSKRGKI